MAVSPVPFPGQFLPLNPGFFFQDNWFYSNGGLAPRGGWTQTPSLSNPIINSNQWVGTQSGAGGVFRALDWSPTVTFTMSTTFTPSTGIDTDVSPEIFLIIGDDSGNDCSIHIDFLSQFPNWVFSGKTSGGTNTADAISPALDVPHTVTVNSVVGGVEVRLDGGVVMTIPALTGPPSSSNFYLTVGRSDHLTDQLVNFSSPA